MHRPHPSGEGRGGCCCGPCCASWGGGDGAHIPQKRGGAYGRVVVRGWEGVKVSRRKVVVEE
jgi:hypothetical protein